MKKALSVILMILLVVSTSFAEINEISIYLNGDLMVLEEQPLIVNGRTLVPVKFIFEPLGLEVSWNNETRTATGKKDGLVIDMTIGDPIVKINGKALELDVAPRIINDRTYVPLRFVAESTGAIVTWHGETRSIAIEYFKTQPYEQLFQTIYKDVNDEDGPTETIIRDQYHAILEQILDLKTEYMTHDIQLKTDLMVLAKSCGLSLNETMTLKDMMDLMHRYKTKQHADLKTDLMMNNKPHEFSNNDAYFGEFYSNKMHGLGYYQFASGGELIGQFMNGLRHGYLSEIYEKGYDYSNFIEDKEEGLEFSYNKLEKGYAYKLTYYKNGLRTGISHQISFDDDKNPLHDAYYKFEEDKSIGLEYVQYKEGFELFDRGAIERDVVVQINPDGNIYIAPTDQNGISDDKFTGFGYLKFKNGVEYIGGFSDWSRLGIGMYYAPDDTTTNLMDQLSDDIIAEIIKKEMTEIEKVKTIHDYLANHILYDPNPIGENDYKDISHTAFGALIDGVAVCDGYAEAFKYLLDKVGIKNILIFGEVDEDGNFEGAVNHAWNLIKLDDKYYHFDLTWDDDDVNNRVLYDYYKKESNFFDDTHQWKLDHYNQYLIQ